MSEAQTETNDDFSIFDNEYAGASDISNKKLQSSICRVNEIYNQKTRKFHLVKASKARSRKLRSKYWLVLRHTFDRKDTPKGTFVDVRGSFIIESLSKIFSDVEDVFVGKDSASLELRYMYYAYNDLRTSFQAQTTSKSKASDTNVASEEPFQLAAALVLIREEYATTMQSVASLLLASEITFDLLWTIIPPNELVYSLAELDQKRAYRAINHEYVRELDGSRSLQIKCSFVDDDGTKIGRAQDTHMKIPDFKGSRKVADLNVFPLRYHPNKDQIRDELIVQGRRRLRFRDNRFNEHDGHGLTEVEDANGRSHFERFHSHGRIIIDHAIFDQVKPNNSFIPTIKHAIPVSDLTDDQILTFPPTVYGFDLKNKIWGAFASSRITEISWDEAIFESLVFSKTQKRLIHTLVLSHVSQSSSFDDIVREKGRGLIGLLVGPPGVGKTLTAEAVAEIAHRPLYVLSSGELGSDPHEMDGRLKEVLNIAHAWGAVLLLDEADVFLTKRDDRDLVRNAVVSIFLRQLEYYQGMLIMTTNRVESIDPAFESRIHFCYDYPELDFSARKLVWKEFLMRARRDSALEIRVQDEDLEELAASQQNGRQIKNIMRMAQSIATEEKLALDADGLKLVTDSLRGFSILGKHQKH